ncbi:MAG: maltose alpha-D-glucosyltransferase, partial [Dehalococcoidia bacterium]|nr:maltose alpha-D-glucosyltransferase [Dehalococcoidia bacterium]
GDGAGDFRGLAEKLDYLQDLGVTAIWLLPFYPSPLKDDGYDIADYTSVHPSYGTLRDFRIFMREAHRRGLRVINELVLNHTSREHPWFERSRTAAPSSRWRDFYVWSDTPEKYADARVIFRDFEPSNWTWDPTARAYYWHRFYHHQPDLNFESPGLRRAMIRVVDFWMEMGVDGMRLDAVPYLFEREGTNCENLPETHEFLRSLRRHVDARFANRMLLAEANQWPEDAVAYFGEGEECHMCFHFPLMPRLFMAIRMEDRYPVIEIMQQTPEIPEQSQWAVFLRNHDELTLEMVTDEDRDYMYRVYATDPQARINLGIRRRLAPLLGNHRRRIELMNGLLFSLPGTPVIYYGDEIGMGDNTYLGDRNGVRTPMQWSGDRNAGFSKANPQRLYLPVIIDPEYHYEALNVEAQQNNTHSLLWWMKRLIALRKRHKAFSRGSLEFLNPHNRKVLAFYRRQGDELILVVANLSRFVQAVELDLSECAGMVPVEMFGQTEFPPIGELPYFVTLGPHTFYWFSLQALRVPAAEARQPDRPPTSIRVKGALDNALSARGRPALQAVLPAFLANRRWFGGKARRVKAATFVDVIPVSGTRSWLTLVRVDYTEGDPETYVLPIGVADGQGAEEILAQLPYAVLAAVESDEGSGLVYEAIWHEGFGPALLKAIGSGRPLKGETGRLMPTRTRSFRSVTRGIGDGSRARVLGTEQSNTSVVFGEEAIFKLIRRTEPGVNPDLEISRYLADSGAFSQVPPLAGALEYQAPGTEGMTVGILHGFVPNEGDAWRYTLDALRQFLERVSLGSTTPHAELPLPPGAPSTAVEVPTEVGELVGPYLEAMRRLGQRTGELHLALTSERGGMAFAPEPFSDHYRQGRYQAMRAQAGHALSLLRSHLDALDEPTRSDAEAVLASEEALRSRFRTVADSRIKAKRIRQHGDYHLGQVLYTGSDFVIIDFEGEPARPLGERRIKRSPLTDVAGMIRSLHYAAHTALLRENAPVHDSTSVDLEGWATFWYRWVTAAFASAYLETLEGSGLLPRDPEQVGWLLDAALLEKAIYELTYELNNRPDWVGIPLKGLLDLVGEGR